MAYKCHADGVECKYHWFVRVLDDTLWAEWPSTDQLLGLSRYGLCSN